MNWESIYKQETGNDADYAVEASNCNRLDYHYNPAYVEWLETKLTEAYQNKE